MTKSKIIQDIGYGEVSLTNVLTRTLIIASNLNNKPFYDWVKKELYGYEDRETLPKYRYFFSSLKIDYVAGHNKVSGYLIPESYVDEKVRDKIPNYILDGISIFEDELDEEFNKSYDLTMFIPFLNIDEGYQVFSMVREISIQSYKMILSKVKQITLEFLLEAEKKFGNLDELDVSKRESDKFNNKINLSIGQMIGMGDNNSFSNTNFSENHLDVSNNNDSEKNKLLWKILVPILVAVISSVITWLIKSYL